MAAILRIGFETSNNNLEPDTGNFSPVFPNTAFSNTHVNGAGSWALRVNPTDSIGTQSDTLQAFPISNPTGTMYGRFYAYFGTLPTTSMHFFAYRDQSNNGPTWRCNNGTTLIVDGPAGAFYPGSIVIPTGTWLRFEWLHDFSNHVGTFSVNGTTFGTMGTSATQGTSASTFYIGYTADLGTSFAGTMDVWYDDIALNDNTGASQNGSLGNGYLSYYTVAFTGDNEQFTIQNGGVTGSQNNYTRVGQMLSSGGTVTSNADTITNHIDDFRVSSTGNQIASNGTINCLRVISFCGNGTASGTNSLVRQRIKNISGGTVLESGDIDPTGGNLHSSLISYTRPNGGVWTKADLDTMQLGYRISSGSAFPVFMTSIFTMVDYNGTSGVVSSGHKNLLGVG